MMDYNEYDEGQVVTIAMSFADVDHAPADPDTIKLELREPTTRIITEFTEAVMTQDATGEWHLDIPTVGFISGTWFYKIYSTGTAEAAKEWAFIIKPTEIPS